MAAIAFADAFLAAPLLPRVAASVFAGAGALVVGWPAIQRLRALV